MHVHTYNALTFGFQLDKDPNKVFMFPPKKIAWKFSELKMYNMKEHKVDYTF